MSDTYFADIRKKSGTNKENGKVNGDKKFG